MQHNVWLFRSIAEQHSVVMIVYVEVAVQHSNAELSRSASLFSYAEFKAVVNLRLLA